MLQPRSPRVVILEEPGGPGLLLQGKWIPRPGHPARGDQEKQGTNLWSRYQRICNLPALLSFHILSPHSRRREGTPLPRAQDRDCRVFASAGACRCAKRCSWKVSTGGRRHADTREKAMDSSYVPLLPSFLSGRRWGAEMPKQFPRDPASKTQRQFLKTTSKLNAKHFFGEAMGKSPFPARDSQW